MFIIIFFLTAVVMEATHCAHTLSSKYVHAVLKQSANTSKICEVRITRRTCAVLMLNNA